MPRVGTTYSPPASSWNPPIGGTPISVADWIALLGDLSTAHSDSLTRGETTAYTLTLLDDATAAAARNTLGIEAAYTDVASAATTDIGATTGQNVRITGTTSITALGTASAGTLRRVRFADALTLTHNGTSLILPGAANITTAANDCATFTSLGAGNWLCTDYTPATTAGQRALSGYTTPATLRNVGFTAAVIDRAYAEYTSFSGLGANIPIDDTIPQVGEGTEILSVTLTPKTTATRFRVRFRGSASANTNTRWLTAALFVNGAANAVAADTTFAATNGEMETLYIEYEYIPGSVSAQTLSIRVGADSGSIAMNGNLATPTRYLGGVMRSTLVVEEIAV